MMPPSQGYGRARRISPKIDITDTSKTNRVVEKRSWYSAKPARNHRKDAHELRRFLIEL